LLVGEAKAVIAGLSITDDNYHVARKLLEEHFGRPENQKFAHIQRLLKLSSAGSSSNPVVLSRLYDTLQTHIRSLEALEITIKFYERKFKTWLWCF
jgi:hypothetical protein